MINGTKSWFSLGPISFQPVDAAHPTGNAFSDDTKDLHSYGLNFATNWVTIHDTATDPSGAPLA